MVLSVEQIIEKQKLGEVLSSKLRFFARPQLLCDSSQLLSEGARAVC